MKNELVKDTKVNSLAQKINKRGVIVSTSSLDGVLKIQKIRKYKTDYSWSPFFHEVDIVFEGKIWGNVNFTPDWHTSEILKTHNISKVKLNRLIRKNLDSYVNDFCELLGLNVKHYGSFKIKNIIWK